MILPFCNFSRHGLGQSLPRCEELWEPCYFSTGRICFQEILLGLSSRPTKTAWQGQTEGGKPPKLLQPVTSDVGQMFLFFCQKTEGSTWLDSRNLASLWRNNVNKPCQLFFAESPKVEDKRDVIHVIKMDCGHKGIASLTWNDKIQDKGVDDVMRRCLLGGSKQF